MRLEHFWLKLRDRFLHQLLELLLQLLFPMEKEVPADWSSSCKLIVEVLGKMNHLCLIQQWKMKLALTGRRFVLVSTLL